MEGEDVNLWRTLGPTIVAWVLASEVRGSGGIRETPKPLVASGPIPRGEVITGCWGRSFLPRCGEHRHRGWGELCHKCRCEPVVGEGVGQVRRQVLQRAFPSDNGLSASRVNLAGVLESTVKTSELFVTTPLCQSIGNSLIKLREFDKKSNSSVGSHRKKSWDWENAVKFVPG